MLLDYLQIVRLFKMFETLERRGVITTDPDKRERCCGLTRDEDGFCRHREYHPVYVEAL